MKLPPPPQEIRSHLLIMIVFLSTCLSSCSSLGPLPKSIYSSMSYYSWLQTASDEEIATEKARLMAAAPSHVTTVQHAMILSVPAQSSDEEKQAAREMLDELLGTSEESEPSLYGSYGEFASVWRTQLTLEHQLREVSAEHALSNQQIEKLETEVEGLKAQIRALNKDLAAFTSIEQQLINRELQQGTP